MSHCVHLDPETWAELVGKHLDAIERAEIVDAALRDTARVTAAINALSGTMFLSEREAALALLHAVRREVGVS